MNDPAETSADESRLRRRTRPAIIYVLTLAAGVFAAWRIHVFQRTGGEVSIGRLDTDTYAQPAASIRPADPMAMAGDPLSAAGLSALEGDPGGIAPPQGATRRAALQRRKGAGLHQQASYDYCGEMSLAAAHYKRSLAAGGFKLLADRAGTPGGQMLVFINGQKRIVVNLRKLPRESKMLRISLTVVSLTAEEESTGR